MAVDTRLGARLLGLAIVAVLAAAALANEPARLPDAPPLPACVTLDECPIPSEVAAILHATGEYGPGDYPPCVEVRGSVCILLPALAGRR